MAISMRSMAAVRLLFSGPMTALSTKALSCCMARTELCNRWHASATCWSSSASSLSTSARAWSDICRNREPTSGQSMVAAPAAMA